MAKSPEKTCPSLYRLIEGAEPSGFIEFLRQDEFSRQQWLRKYSDAEPTDHAVLEGLLQEKKKTRLEPLEREASRIIVVAERRGQFALEGLARTKLKPEERQTFRLQKDDLSRSLWTYLHHRLLFEAVESVIHRRLYRTYGKHYQSFQPGEVVGRGEEDFGKVRDMLIAEIEAQLDMGEGCSIERFDIPADGDVPAAEMYIIYHPNPPTSAREIREDGERRTIYFRPPGEATVVFTPSTSTIEVRGDTRVIRRDVADSFAKVVLKQNLSSKPLGFREYDLSRFFESFALDSPSLDGFHIRSAGVIKAEISIGHLGNRLSIQTTIDDDIDKLIDRQSGLRHIFQHAIAIRFIEIAVRHVRRGETQERTLDFTVSDQNSCSLLSLADAQDRILGHRLLRHWQILTEFRQADSAEDRVIMPVLLEIWDAGLEELAGSWLRERGIDETSLTSAGFLEPIGWEEIDLVDEDHIGLVGGRVVTAGRGGDDKVYIQPSEGQEVQAGDARRYRKFRVNQSWMIEHVQTALADALEAPLVEVLSPDLTALGSVEIDGRNVPVYLVRRLDDPKVLADSEPYRVCRRLQLLRRWSHHEQDNEQVLSGSASTCGAVGTGS